MVDGFSTGGGPTEILGLVVGDDDATAGVEDSCEAGGGDGGSSFLISDEMSKPRNGFCPSLAVRVAVICGGGDDNGSEPGRPSR